MLTRTGQRMTHEKRGGSKVDTNSRDILTGTRRIG